MKPQLVLLCIALFAASALGAAVPKTEVKVEPGEVEDARNKLIFLAEKLLVLKKECMAFKDVNWNIETSNHFVDTLDSLVAVDANPTLVADLRVRASAEKQQVIDKLTSLDTSFNNLRTQIFKISEKMRQETYAEISEHFVQFKAIASDIESKHTDYQSTLSFVISDLELATLLAINGNNDPNVADVHKYLQQSKDAATNANNGITEAEQLYTNAKNDAETAVEVIVSQTDWKKVQKREISSFRSKGDAQPEDVIQAQLDIQMWINHLISLNTKFGRLNNAMRLEVADSFVQIFKSMRELQVDEGTVSSIETDNRIDGQLLEVTISALWTTMQTVYPTLNSINYELNFIDKNTRDELQKLIKRLEDTEIGAINADFNAVFNSIDTNLPITLDNIRNAIAGLSGDPVISIHLGIQVIENTFSSNRQDIMSEKPLYDNNVSNFLSVLNKIIDDLCSGLFC